MELRCRKETYKLTFGDTSIIFLVSDSHVYSFMRLEIELGELFFDQTHFRFV